MVMAQISSAVKEKEEVKREKKKICPIMSAGREIYDFCQEDRCVFWDNRYKSCLVLATLINLSGLTDAIRGVAMILEHER